MERLGNYISGKNQVPITLNWQSADPRTGFLPTHNPGGSTPSGNASGSMTGTAVLYSQILDVAKMDSLGLELDWTSTPIGVFQILGSVSGASFYSVASLFSPTLAQPSGSNSGYLGEAQQYGYRYFMVIYTNTSSSGTLTGYVQVKDLN